MLYLSLTGPFYRAGKYDSAGKCCPLRYLSSFYYESVLSGRKGGDRFWCSIRSMCRRKRMRESLDEKERRESFCAAGFPRLCSAFVDGDNAEVVVRVCLVLVLFVFFLMLDAFGPGNNRVLVAGIFHGVNKSQWLP